MTLARCTLLACLLCLALAAPAAAPASRGPEAHLSACPDSIRLGNRTFAYYQHRVNCTRARRAVRRLYATYGREGRPRGFRCRSRNRFRRSGACRSGSRYFLFSR